MKAWWYPRILSSVNKRPSASLLVPSSYVRDSRSYMQIKQAQLYAFEYRGGKSLSNIYSDVYGRYFTLCEGGAFLNLTEKNESGFLVKPNSHKILDDESVSHKCVTFGDTIFADTLVTNVMSVINGGKACAIDTDTYQTHDRVYLSGKDRHLPLNDIQRLSKTKMLIRFNGSTLIIETDEGEVVERKQWKH